MIPAQYGSPIMKAVCAFVFRGDLVPVLVRAGSSSDLLTQAKEQITRCFAEVRRQFENLESFYPIHSKFNVSPHHPSRLFPNDAFVDGQRHPVPVVSHKFGYQPLTLSDHLGEKQRYHIHKSSRRPQTTKSTNIVPFSIPLIGRSFFGYLRRVLLATFQGHISEQPKQGTVFSRTSQFFDCTRRVGIRTGIYKPKRSALPLANFFFITSLMRIVASCGGLVSFYI